MAKIATDFEIQSDLIKHEYAPQWGYCRGNITVPAAKVIGDLVTSAGGVPAAAADIAGVVMRNTAAGGSALVLQRGPVGVLATTLKLGSLTKSAVVARLNALGIQVIEEYL